MTEPRRKIRVPVDVHETTLPIRESEDYDETFVLPSLDYFLLQDAEGATVRVLLDQAEAAGLLARLSQHVVSGSTDHFEIAFTGELSVDVDTTYPAKDGGAS